ncbi:Asp-tRNA(Asn)/Glu-tRNA(Gln) amidotransferase subunit GatC [Caenibacillus caldisaponilyticus]|uniref:Asp-tRNA(Asn)/Glu-tRNA(Gln) amidotransferase subunit GatC n=1 Tax=Caenibacillus caldisaponilyticus TaxID=1674942 RepID=UPI0009885BF3|nr:Asp-tRNA(Asn)/Glu-tRNA(Gln) amidotransferase subunit GatC [Caenibacillus caldisaponilyticus]
MARITKEQVEHVADLARLAFTDEEIAVFTKDLGDIIAFAEQLNELDTDGIEETTHVLNIANVMRPDEVRESISREEALLNAPDKRDGQVRVPNILEG